MSPAPESPCIGRCQVAAEQVCLGCGRHIDEIVEWSFVDDGRKSEILAASRRRLALLYPERSADERRDEGPGTV